MVNIQVTLMKLNHKAHNILKIHMKVNLSEVKMTDIQRIQMKQKNLIRKQNHNTEIQIIKLDTKKSIVHTTRYGILRLIMHGFQLCLVEIMQNGQNTKELILMELLVQMHFLMQILIQILIIWLFLIKLWDNRIGFQCTIAIKCTAPIQCTTPTRCTILTQCIILTQCTIPIQCTVAITIDHRQV